LGKYKLKKSKKKKAIKISIMVISDERRRL
jgi:hypothetical protein